MLDELFRGVDDDDERGMWRSLMIFFGVVLGAFAGHVITKEVVYRQAADRNAGRWVVDAKTGAAAWEWTGRGE